jgi:hypothetical protein
MDEESSLFLHHLRVSTALNSVSSEVTASEWVGTMKEWRETTTTNPIGVHLGHHKTLVREFPPTDEAPPSGVVTLESNVSSFYKAISISSTMPLDTHTCTDDGKGLPHS